MLHSPLFFVWIGWVLIIGVIAVVRGIYARRKERRTGTQARGTGFQSGRTPSGERTIAFDAAPAKGYTVTDP